MKKFFMVLMVLFAVLMQGEVFSQKEYYNWCFGRYAGITFNTPNMVPKAITYNQIDAMEGCSSISDKNGKLEFYTNGEKVWNRNHFTMMNGDSLMGSKTSTQTAFIIPVPERSTLYYIFTVDYTCMSTTSMDSSCSRGLRYSIVDITLDDYQGAITDKNVLLLPYTTEKLTAVVHKNKKDIWILTHEWNSDRFAAFLVTSKGVEKPVFSSCGTIHSTKTDVYDGAGIGYMKVSKSGDRLGLAIYMLNIVELFDFDNSTGKVTNPISLKSDTNFDLTECYGIEFSPDASKLYISRENSQGKIIQLDLNSYNKKDIINSFSIINNENYDFLALQMGPDDKIYCLATGSPYLGVIKNPNAKGSDCEFKINGVFLEGKYAWYGLPPILNTIFKIDVTIGSNSSVCFGDTIKLYAKSEHGAVYEWVGPKGFTSTLQNPIIPNATQEYAGEYKVTVILNSSKGVAKTNIIINNPPQLRIIGNNKICEGDSSFLKSTQKYINYLWSTGDTTDNTTVFKDGKYWLQVIDTNGCTGSDTVEISYFPKPVFSISGVTTICKGDSTILSVNPLNKKDTYLWSTGDFTSQIIAKIPGIYKLTVTNESGCKDSNEIEVKEIPEINAKISGKNYLCKGAVTDLFAEPTGSGYKYLWSKGDTSQKISIDSPGKYWVKVTLNNNCFGNDTIEIKELDLPIVKIIGDTLFCPNDSIKLRTDKDFAIYLWNTSDTAKSISVSLPGTYSVNVTDTNGCTGSATFEVKQYDIKITGLKVMDFGKILPGKNNSGNFSVQNNSNADVDILSIKTKNGTPEFKITSNPAVPFKLLKGDKLDITITYEPTFLKNYSDSLMLEIGGPCPENLSSYLTGTTYAITTIFIPEVIAYIGTDSLCIPLKAMRDSNIVINDTLSYTAEIRYEASALIPKNQFPVEFGDRVISLSGSNIIFNKNEIELGDFCGDVMLANSDITPLRITKFQWNNPLIDTIIKDGNLIVKGLCAQSLSRLQLFTPLQLTITPNPASELSVISYKLSDEENVKLTLVSCLGQEVAVLVNEQQQKGEHHYQFSIVNYQLSCGVYKVCLSTQGYKIFQTLGIIK